MSDEVRFTQKGWYVVTYEDGSVELHIGPMWSRNLRRMRPYRQLLERVSSKYGQYRIVKHRPGQPAEPGVEQALRERGIGLDGFDVGAA